jgi:hypothetical protein
VKEWVVGDKLPERIIVIVININFGSLSEGPSRSVSLYFSSKVNKNPREVSRLRDGEVISFTELTFRKITLMNGPTPILWRVRHL